MRRGLILVTAVLLGMTLVLPAAAGAREKQGMVEFELPNEPVRGHTSINRGADSVDVDVHLRGLTPGNAITVWAVIWNEPGNCDGACGEDDLGVDGNAVIWTGIGGVVNGGGNFNGQGYLEVDVVGDGPIPGALEDSQLAEIHFVVQDHGEASDDPAVLEVQTTEFEGGCGNGVPGIQEGDTCVDVQAVIFK